MSQLCSGTRLCHRETAGAAQEHRGVHKPARQAGFQRGVRGHKGRAQLSGLQGGVSGDQANLQGFSTLLLAWTTPGGGATPRKLHPQTSSQHSAPSSS